MPSKQKKKKKSGRGKAKKVAVGSSKHTKKEKQQAAIDIDAQMEQSIDVQKKQLMISGSDNSQPYDEASLLEEAIKLAAAEREALKSGPGETEESTKPKRIIVRPWQCHHGYEPKGREYHFKIDDFCRTFRRGFDSDDCEELILNCIYAAHTVTIEKYPEVWSDTYKLKLAITYFLLQGTQHVLEGNLTSARKYAFLAHFLQDSIDYRDENKGITELLVNDDLLYTDEHTLVKYLRKNIPCNCLDERYKEVKSITKIGRCWNAKCNEDKVKLSTMMCCDRCRSAVYCSRECQKADWHWHKKRCDHIGKTSWGAMALFDS